MSEKITFEVTDQKEEITFSFSEAARGPAGSDANVTNANVNAAIEDDPEATREALEIPIDNFSAITAPTINDDSSDGYSAGSKWYDTVGQEAYLCVDASVGAAVWILATLTADDLGSAAFTASTDYATAAQGALADSALQPSDLSSPPAIGDVTPNSGAFTTLSATGTATLPHIHGGLAGNLYIHVRNTTGGILSRGTPIYIVGNVGDTDRVTVAAADNTNAAKMPAVGLLEESLNNNGDGNAIIVGELPAANTNSYSINQELYVGVGAITGTKPTTGEVQSVGVVARVNTNTGVIVVNMQGRRTRDGAFATAAQGALADSAVQPGDLATVATTGAYADLSGTPDLSGYATTTELADYLPLAGGTMDEDATIVWDNASAIREAGAEGLEIECSVGYRWQWVSGRMILRQVNSGQIARILAIDGVIPTSTDDDTNGFVVGTQWEITDGTVYVCTDATTSSAVWVYQAIRDTANVISIDQENRKLIDAVGTEVLNWSSSSVNIPIGIYLGVDVIYDADSPSRYIDVVNGELGDFTGTSTPSIDWANRQLIASDGVSVSADWYNGYLYDGAEISLDWIYRSLTGSDNLFAINWGDRQLCGTGGSTCVDWSSGTPVFSFGATLTPTAVSSLVGNEGTIAYVNDADTPVIGSAVVAGASAKCLVCYNGTSWIVTALL